MISSSSQSERTLNALKSKQCEITQNHTRFFSLSHQVNTLFLFDCSRKEREMETRDEGRENRKNVGRKETTDFGRAVATSLCIKSKDRVIRQH